MMRSFPILAKGDFKMFKTNGKTNINKYMLISLLVICLFFTAMGFNMENSYAVELNDTDETMCVDVNVVNQSEISLNEKGNYDVENNGEILNAKNDDGEVLSSEWSVMGGHFHHLNESLSYLDNQSAVVVCTNYYYQEGDPEGPGVEFHKQYVIRGWEGIKLDGRYNMPIFKLAEGSEYTILYNFSFYNASGISGSAIEVCVSNILIENCTFTANHCNYGGVVSIAENVTNVTIRNCTFIGNFAHGENFEGIGRGAAIGVFGSNCTIEGCVFDSNWAKGIDGAYSTTIETGSNVEGLIIKNCTFLNNHANNTDSISYGGALAITNNINVTNCTFINNSATFGGALMLYISYDVENCIFINNTADEYGGAVYFEHDVSININNSTFDGNKAVKGGAIHVDCVDFSINNSDFINNYADYGGALNIESDNVIISDSRFVSNYAEINGGAIFINAEGSKILNSNFTSNFAKSCGGAVYVNSSNTVIESSEFNLNKAGNGSAVYFDKNGRKLTITNSEFHNNQARGYLLTLFAESIYYADTEHINMTLTGGNNIVDFNNPLISNAIYSASESEELEIDGVHPVDGYGMTGLYKYDVPYNTSVLLTLVHEDGSIAYNNTYYSNYLGQIFADIDYLKPGRYNVTAKSLEDSHYIYIENSTQITVYAKVDTKVIISSNVDEYRYVDEVNWTLNITNIGLNEASGINVTFLLPESLIFMDSNVNDSYNHTIGVLNISKLEVGEEFIANIITKINATGDFNLKANVSALEFDTNKSNNDDELNFTVNPSSDLVIFIESNCSNCNYYDLVNWTITVKNNGPDIAHNVKVHDLITNTLIPEEYSEGYDLETSSWEIDALEVGGEVVFNLITKVNITGTIINNLEVNGSEYDFKTNNNKISYQINVYPTSDLEINVSLNSTNINYLDYLTLTLTISNNGLDNASDVKVGNILPNGFTYINSTIEYIDNEFYIGNLSSGSSETIDIYCKVDITGTCYNNANISGFEYDFDTSNNIHIKEIIVNPSCELEISQTVTNLNPNFYELVNWTITVKNNGPDIAHNVVVDDLLSNSLLYIKDSSDNDYNHVSGKWNIESIGIGESVSITITSRVINSGAIVNYINCSCQEYDYNMDNNNYSISIKVNSSSDLTLNISSNASNVNYHDNIKFIITIKNNGVDNASNVKVSDVLPIGFIYINSTVEYWHNTFDIGNLSLNEELTIEINCKVNTTGVYYNHASVNCDEYDYNLTNNKDNVGILVNNSSNLEITQNMTNFKPNYLDLVNLTITVKNNGNMFNRDNTRHVINVMIAVVCD